MKIKAICLALCTVSAISLYGMCAYAQAANDYEGGSGTASSPYLIANASQLELLRDTVNAGESYDGVSFRLTADIDLGGSQWTPIGTEEYAFSGRFDGGRHTVSGLNVDTEYSNAGLFGYISCADISYLTVSGSVTGNENVGGVAGYSSSSTITGCINRCAVTGQDNTGGIVGYTEWSVTDHTASVALCSSEGTVSGNYSTGGIAGTCTAGTVTENCYNTGAVSGDDNYTGGVVGYTGGTVRYCYDYAQITGGTYTGGITGYKASDAIINYSYYLEDNAEKSIGNTNDSGANVHALSAEEFADASNAEDNFKGWDFDGIWIMSDSLGRPVFKTETLVEKYFAGVFDAHEDAPAAAAFFVDVTAGTYTVTGVDWSVDLGDYIAAPAEDEKFKPVTIAGGSTVRFGIVVSTGDTGVDVNRITTDTLTITTVEGGISE